MSRNSATFAWPSKAAKCRLFLPLSMTSSILAPWSTRSFAMSVKPCWQATWRGVHCFESLAETSEPFWIKNSATLYLPFRTALWSGVLPFFALELTTTGMHLPEWSKRTISRCPSWEARWRGVQPSLSVAVTRSKHPGCSRICSMHLMWPWKHAAWMAFRPVLLVRVRLGFCSQINFTTSGCPSCDARITAVQPSSSWTFTSIPCSKRTFVHSINPSKAARWRAVLPIFIRSLTNAPCLRRHLAIRGWP